VRAHYDPSVMTRLRWLTAGESHGPALVVIVEGMPAGLPIGASDVDRDLARRQQGYGRGGRMKIEHDHCEIQSGVRGGETLGSPIALRIANRDFANWTDRMGAEPFATPPERVTRPRPGHADLAGGLKYDRRDLRDVLERASARETAARVAAGALARVLLRACGVEVASRVVAIAGVCDTAERTPESLVRFRDAIDDSSLRVMDPEIEAKMRERIYTLSHDGDTAGGIVEAVAIGVPPGLGSYVQWDRKLDGRIAQAIASVHAIKAVEIGDGWGSAAREGSAVHDAIGYDANARRFTHATNRAGGLEGGVSNGEPVVVRAAMKPIPTLRKPLASVDIDSKAPTDAAHERSDVCAVPAASVVVEAMLALVLADALLEKFASDSMTELARALAGYRAQVEAY